MCIVYNRHSVHTTDTSNAVPLQQPLQCTTHSAHFVKVLRMGAQTLVSFEHFKIKIKNSS